MSRSIARHAKHVYLFTTVYVVVSQSAANNAWYYLRRQSIIIITLHYDYIGVYVHCRNVYAHNTQYRIFINISRFSQNRLRGTRKEVRSDFWICYRGEAGASTHVVGFDLSQIVSDIRSSQCRRPGEKTAVFRTFFGKSTMPWAAAAAVFASGDRSTRLRKGNLIWVPCKTIKRLTSRQNRPVAGGI